MFNKVLANIMKKQILNNTIILLIFICVKSFSQNSSYVVTSSNDTIYVDKFNILNKKIKLQFNGDKKEYNYDELKGIYDSKKKRFLEKISPLFVEYKGPTGNTFFAERLTKGKVKIYKYLTNEAHIPINGVGGSNSFYIYYICIEYSRPEFLCYYEMQMSKEEYKILKLYLHSNDDIQKELETLFFSEKDKKENSIIELVNTYNIWAESKK